MASFVHVLRELVQDDEWEALDLFLQISTDVEKDLETLFELQEFMPQVPQDAMLRFVEALPQDRWIISACDVMLKRSERWDCWAVALVLRKAMQRSVGQTLMTAEILWARRLSLAARALACSSPVTITSAINDNVLYVAGSSNCGDFFQSEQEPPTSVSDFYIVSVYAQEFLYASEFPVTSDAEGFAMKRVLVKRGNDLPEADKIWRLQLLEDGKCAFYNEKHDAFLSSPPEAGDGSRRTVLTAPFRPLDEKRSARREWRIRASGSKLEMALVHFFSRKYSKAFELFTGILTKDEISAADRRKVLCYRMAANLLLKNDGCFKQDLTQVEELGGYPDYFFDTLASKLTDQDQKLLRQRHNLEEEWKREEGVREKLSEFAVKHSHYKTDPNARSPYVFFFNDLCQQVRNENPTKNVVEIAVLLTEMWRVLPDKDRAKYEKMHEEAKLE
ncbi:hypothetical protein PF003_g29117 [Phytophthora fragariae]|nr:hypothetical protein PF003_g29117 [Phytophthora fragariae]